MRIIDDFRWMVLSSGIRSASETDELELVRLGVSEARKRLNGARTVYAAGGCGWGYCGEVVGES